MELAAALARIGHTGPVAPDLATLRALHRAWLASVPYENLDIQLERGISLEPSALVDKLITRRRGGYCYEMNGALGLLLEAAGFTVTRVKAGVYRETRGDEVWGNHLALLVALDGETWLADVGLGDGALEPLPLRAGHHTVGPLGYRIARIEEQIWRISTDHPDYSVPSFDIDTTPRRLADFAERNSWQSTSPDSSFVKTLALLRPHHDHAAALRGRTVTRYGPAVPGGKQTPRAVHCGGVRGGAGQRVRGAGGRAGRRAGHAVAEGERAARSLARQPGGQMSGLLQEAGTEGAAIVQVAGTAGAAIMQVAG
ncbi:MAG: arylamine N-acetyltransferase family protein [Micromonosporaceae bacterium]